MEHAALSAALGKALTDLDNATRDARTSSVMNIKPKIERVAALQADLNRLLASAVYELAREVAAMKGGTHG